MTILDWIVLLAGSALALGFAYWTYTRREPAGRGRMLLTALRTATLVLLILLLIDPRFGSTARVTRNNTRVILDASLSMMPRAADSAAWQRAVREAQSAASGPVIVAGDAPRLIAHDSLARLQPRMGSSRMLPALQAAAEAGAQRVVLVTDGALDDAGEIARWLPRLGIAIDVKQVEPVSVPNRAIAEIEAPAWAEAGQPMQIRISVAARGPREAEPAAVVVRQNNDIVASANIALNAVGLSSATLTFNAEGPAAGGLVRYDVAFETQDSIPDDDVRSAYVFVSERPAGIALVSFLPDWEPKFLHPVLAQALGLPVRTFLRVPNGSYVRGGEGLDAGIRVEEDVVQRAVAQADLVVLHGVTENAPAWWRDVARTAARLLVLPTDALGDPFNIDAGVAGDWYISPDVPPSPIAAFLQSIDVRELPPLEALFAASSETGDWAPLTAGRTRRGGRTPVLLAQQSGARRIAVALGSGYWRWAFRGGNARDVYTRLWGSLAGWLTQDQAQVAGAAIRPVHRTIARGEAVRWRAPGLVVDSLHMQITDEGGRVVQRATVTEARGDTLLTAPLPAGHYRYVAQAFSGDARSAEANGPLTVESYSAEFMQAPVNLRDLRSTTRTLARTNATSGTPLHALPWAYLLMVVLLCSEWVLRRRWGLR
jgi:hypothetical protein